VGASLIAADRRANALQIYLSKPLLRMEYIGGKLAILATFLVFVTVVPGLLLILLQVMFAGNLEFLKANLHVIPAVVLASLVRVAVASFTMLALSSLSKSTRYVSILYAGVIFFTEAIYGVMRVITGSSRVAWISITANMENVTDVMFRQAPRYDAPVIVSVLVLIGLVVVSVSVLERRVRGVEVVS
jgi:ABC-type transport system involved in multi-copper enzyme maturation permease subunit